MKSIAIANQKGGVGKSTTAHILSTGLLKKGFKVLEIDTDPQTNLTFTAGIDPIESELTLYEILKGEAPAYKAIQTCKAGFDIIPGSMDLAAADMEFKDTGREYMLKEALEPLQAKYDYCIIDTAPSLSVMTINALTAAQKVIVPMIADIYSLQGLSQLQKLIESVQRYCNKSLVIDGLLITQYSKQAVISRQMKESIEEIAKKLNTRLYSTQIRKAVAVQEMQLSQGNIFIDNPGSNVAKDYEAFIDELLKGEK